MIVREAEAIELRVRHDDSLAAKLTDEEYATVIRLGDSIDGNPPGRTMDWESEKFFLHIDQKISADS